MILLPVVTIIAIFANVVLGLFVYYKNPKSATNILFLILTVSIALWSVANYFSLTVPSSQILFWIRAVMLFATPLSASFFLLMHTFPKDRIQLKPLFFTSYLILVFATMIAAVSPFLFTTVVVKGSSIQPTPGPLIPLFMLVAVGSILAGIIRVIDRFRRARGILRTQFRYILLGTAAMFALILLSDVVFVLLFKISTFVLYSPVYTLVFVGAVGYTIVRHRFMDIRLVIARTVSYALLIGGIASIYSFYLAYIVSFLTANLSKLGSFTISTGFTLLLIFLFQPLRRLAEKITDKVFYKNKYDTSKLMYDLTLIMASTLRLEDLTHQLLVTLLSEMRISKGAFILTLDDKIYEVAYEGFTEAPEYDEEKMHKVLVTNTKIITDEIEEGEIKEVMKILDFSVVIPLTTEGEKIGLLALEGKLSGDSYTYEDIRLLEIFSEEAAIAIQNAKAYEEIRRFNITLTEEVDRATKELRDANEKLKQLDKLKDEFVSLASHELRTPMTVIKSYLWMILQNKVDRTSEKGQQYLDRVFKSTEDLISLVNGMLNVSRIEAGKIIVQPVPTDIVKWAKDYSEDLKPRSEETGVSVEVVTPADGFPQAMADNAKIREVFTNIVGNSFKFTPKGGKISISFENKDGMVTIHIADNGKGIAPDDMPKLFQKFGQTGSDVLTRPLAAGTGLGLYITKAIVELHGGKIWATSEGEGKGTTFSFSLKEATAENIKETELKNNQSGETPQSAQLQPAAV